MSVNWCFIGLAVIFLYFAWWVWEAERSRRWYEKHGDNPNE